MTLFPVNPPEHREQTMLFDWAAWAVGQYPELELMYASPNGGHRIPAVAVKLKREGVKRGVPDICLPVARRGYHGLYIELKRLRGGTVSPDQKAFIAKLQAQGYRATVCAGFESARQEIEEYLG
jgi:hypothetical protein